MEKVELVVLGLSASPAGNNAYALILKEAEGDRRMPIIIGAFEAQAIALEMEGVEPPRPMTHDLFKSYIEETGNSLVEVYINDLSDGTFFAKLIYDPSGYEIDARPSDAIAMAVRFGCPIFVNESIISETGVIPQADEVEGQEVSYNPAPTNETPKSKVDRLQLQLDKAVDNEDYEKAASIRDEIKRLLESQ